MCWDKASHITSLLRIFSVFLLGQVWELHSGCEPRRLGAACTHISPGVLGKLCLHAQPQELSHAGSTAAPEVGLQLGKAVQTNCGFKHWGWKEGFPLIHPVGSHRDTAVDKSCNGYQLDAQTALIPPADWRKMVEYLLLLHVSACWTNTRSLVC